MGAVSHALHDAFLFGVLAALVTLTLTCFIKEVPLRAGSRAEEQIELPTPIPEPR